MLWASFPDLEATRCHLCARLNFPVAFVAFDTADHFLLLSLFPLWWPLTTHTLVSLPSSDTATPFSADFFRPSRRWLGPTYSPHSPSHPLLSLSLTYILLKPSTSHQPHVLKSAMISLDFSPLNLSHLFSFCQCHYPLFSCLSTGLDIGLEVSPPSTHLQKQQILLVILKPSLHKSTASKSRKPLSYPHPCFLCWCPLT